ncbi:hypothetical protein THRCLA_08310 [Thraustotheca clavata]|uniref:Matrin-type domain-containing protein n=1 Tax=Thraustotheca clavata TaxID=74557 RepID=A0A1V9Z7T9_9STRA|nr:hypothetical protein THRCLA_08310 [Thraustotheca clavata]
MEKHHCTYCNIWIPGDRISIQNHDASQRHKERTQKQYQIRTREREVAQREEAKQQRELQQVEQAARGRFARGLSGQPVEESNVAFDMPAVGPLPRQMHEIIKAVAPPPPPPRKVAPLINSSVMAPPPPPRPIVLMPQSIGDFQNTSQLQQPPPPPAKKKKKSKKAPPAPPKDTRPKKSDGFYRVRGIVYLEGSFHEIKLVPKKNLEVWVEDLEDWRPATITKVIETRDTSTSKTRKEYAVEYQVNDEDENEKATGTFTSDQLRIPLSLPSDTMTDDQVGVNGFLDALYHGKPTTPYIPTRTPGYGAWSTVSVRIVDEVAEEKARVEEIAAFEAKKKVIQDERDNEVIMEEALHADNALGAFNPWGGNYKGISLENESNVISEDEAPATEPVAFKKRARKDKTARNTRVKYDA